MQPQVKTNETKIPRQHSPLDNFIEINSVWAHKRQKIVKTYRKRIQLLCVLVNIVQKKKAIEQNKKQIENICIPKKIKQIDKITFSVRGEVRNGFEIAF